MPTVADFGAFRIVMYFDDHNPPHVHVVGPDFAAKLRLSDQEVIAGNIPGKVEKRAARYVAENIIQLARLWDRYSGGYEDVE